MIEIFVIGIVVGFVLGLSAHNWNISKKIELLIDKIERKDSTKL